MDELFQPEAGEFAVVVCNGKMPCSAGMSHSHWDPRQPARKARNLFVIVQKISKNALLKAGSAAKPSVARG